MGKEVEGEAPVVEPPVVLVDPIDRHSALIVRGAILGTGLVGLALFLRNSRLFARFENAAQIPKEFIRKELAMKGKVRDVLPSGMLAVVHQPTIRLPQLLSFKTPAEPGALVVRLAGVEVSDAGMEFLSKDLRLKNKDVIFSVVKVPSGQSNVIDAEVTLKKKAFLRTNLNVELVRRGLARVPSPAEEEHLAALQSVSAYSRLVSKLLMSEKIADRRGVGVWQRDTWVESLASFPSQLTQIVKQSAVGRFVVLMYVVSRDTATSGYQMARRGYAASVAYYRHASSLARKGCAVAIARYQQAAALSRKGFAKAQSGYRYLVYLYGRFVAAVQRTIAFYKSFRQRGIKKPP